MDDRPPIAGPDPVGEVLDHILEEDGIIVALARFERNLIERAMERNDGIKRRAAAALQISRYALERRLQRLAKILPTEGCSDSCHRAGAGFTSSQVAPSRDLVVSPGSEWPRERRSSDGAR